MLFTHVLILSTTGIRYYEEKPQRIWNRIVVLPTLRGTVGPLHHRGTVMDKNPFSRTLNITGNMDHNLQVAAMSSPVRCCLCLPD